MSGKPANAKGAARLAAVQALYQLDIGESSVNDVLEEFEQWRLGRELDGVLYRNADAAFFRRLVSGVVEAQRDLDPKIHLALAGDWPLGRIDVTLRALLRTATRELLAHKDVPARVVISEYVDVARAFFDGDEPGIVNAVLDRLARQLRPEEFASAAPREAG